jgi:hypothetical protein
MHVFCEQMTLDTSQILCERSGGASKRRRASREQPSASEDDGGGFTARCAGREQTSASVGRRPLVVGGVMSETGFLFREVR